MKISLADSRFSKLAPTAKSLSAVRRPFQRPRALSGKPVGPPNHRFAVTEPLRIMLLFFRIKRVWAILPFEGNDRFGRGIMNCLGADRVGSLRLANHFLVERNDMRLLAPWIRFLYIRKPLANSHRQILCRCPRHCRIS